MRNKRTDNYQWKWFTAIAVIFLFIYTVVVILPDLKPDGYGYEMARLCCQNDWNVTPADEDCKWFIDTWMGGECHG